jgi:hypothetical protein
LLQFTAPGVQNMWLTCFLFVGFVVDCSAVSRLSVPLAAGIRVRISARRQADEICYIPRVRAAMIYLKSAIVGIVAALAAAAIWILVVFVLPIAIPFLVSRLPGNETGSAGGHAVISEGSILAVALVGFVAGFYSQFRRTRNRRG